MSRYWDVTLGPRLKAQRTTLEAYLRYISLTGRVCLLLFCFVLFCFIKNNPVCLDKHGVSRARVVCF